jgi:diaminohydroxyphosphoribosylaminopyrimidine deaminase / 5-amino-6-(5-phosphoribosylamino)uracil reductase
MNDEIQAMSYMNQALKHAASGIGSVEPNPAVGAVIVKDGQIIGKGFHKKFGGPHAEINALADCKAKGNDPAGATMYVTLEPCCHFGKTPPCADALIEAKIVKVVAAVVDPAPHAAGKGIEKLRAAGVEVEVGICEKEASILNAPVFKFVKTNLPWVILKWAQSIDGKLAYANPKVDGRWLSNEQSRIDAHDLRRRVQAVLVGINTVIADDPLLTPRPANGKNPLRVVLDVDLHIPHESKLLQTASESPLLVITSHHSLKYREEAAHHIIKRGGQVLPLPMADGQCDLNAMLIELGKRQIQQLLVEGGPTVLASFLKQNLADEVRVYIAPKILGSAGAASITEAMTQVTNALNLDNVTIKNFDSDICLSGMIIR